jgi:hypothetical protein
MPPESIVTFVAPVSIDNLSASTAPVTSMPVAVVASLLSPAYRE